MSNLPKKTCLSIDCPERTGGECTASVNNLPNDKKLEDQLKAVLLGGTSIGKTYEEIVAQQMKFIQAYGDTRELEGRYDELTLVPVIETKGVGYEVIVGHRINRFAAIKDKTHE